MVKFTRGHAESISGAPCVQNEPPGPGRSRALERCVRAGSGALGSAPSRARVCECVRVLGAGGRVVCSRTPGCA